MDSKEGLNLKLGTLVDFVERQEKEVIPLFNVAYFFANQAVVWAFLIDGRIKVVENTLFNLGELLSGKKFERVHRAYIVNKAHVLDVKIERRNQTTHSSREGGGGYLLISCRACCERTYKRSHYHIIPLSRRVRKLNLIANQIETIH